MCAVKYRRQINKQHDEATSSEFRHTSVQSNRRVHNFMTAHIRRLKRIAHLAICSFINARVPFSVKRQIPVDVVRRKPARQFAVKRYGHRLFALFRDRQCPIEHAPCSGRAHV